MVTCYQITFTQKEEASKQLTYRLWHQELESVLTKRSNVRCCGTVDT